MTQVKGATAQSIDAQAFSPSFFQRSIQKIKELAQRVTQAVKDCFNWILSLFSKKPNSLSGVVATQQIPSNSSTTQSVAVPVLGSPSRKTTSPLPSTTPPKPQASAQPSRVSTPVPTESLAPKSPFQALPRSPQMPPKPLSPLAAQPPIPSTFGPPVPSTFGPSQLSNMVAPSFPAPSALPATPSKQRHHKTPSYLTLTPQRAAPIQSAVSSVTVAVVDHFSSEMQVAPPTFEELQEMVASPEINPSDELSEIEIEQMSRAMSTVYWAMSQIAQGRMARPDMTAFQASWNEGENPGDCEKLFAQSFTPISIEDLPTRETKMQALLTSANSTGTSVGIFYQKQTPQESLKVFIIKPTSRGHEFYIYFPAFLLDNRETKIHKLMSSQAAMNRIGEKETAFLFSFTQAKPDTRSEASEFEIVPMASPTPTEPRHLEENSQ